MTDGDRALLKALGQSNEASDLFYFEILTDELQSSLVSATSLSFWLAAFQARVEKNLVDKRPPAVDGDAV